MGKKIDWQGHRGCRGLRPENTLSAFIKAIDLGVTTIEMDVVISGDHKVVVSHEPYFSYQISTPPKATEFTPITEKAYNLFEMPYSEIKKWDVGLKGNKNFPLQLKVPSYKPLLKDTIETVEKYISDKNLQAVNYSIEIKSFKEQEPEFQPTACDFADLVLNEIQKTGIQKRTVIQAFDYRILNAIKSQDKEIKCSFLFEDDIKALPNAMKMLKVKPNIVGLEYQLVSKEIISYFHDQGILVIPWTINKKNEILDLIDKGVDGIITDYPNLIEEISFEIEKYGIGLAAVT